MNVARSLGYILLWNLRSCSSKTSGDTPFRRHFITLSIIERHSWFGDGFGYKRFYKSAPLQERKMIDRKKVHVKGGDGGDGCTSFRKSRHDRYGVADGGRGGRGGDVIFVCTDEFWDFGHLQPHYNAKKGGPGSSKKRIGTTGDDQIVRVPMGTVVHLLEGGIPEVSMVDDAQTEIIASRQSDYEQDLDEDEDKDLNETSCTDKEKEELNHLSLEEIEDSGFRDSEEDSAGDDELVETVKPKFVTELLKPGETFKVAEGGEGGRGNAAMARGRGANKQLPSKKHENGKPGTEAFLVLELKTIADVGFVGAPNAGKSTLLGAISRAKPKVGHYAFTTLRPNLGKLEFEDFLAITVADIPGLIKGAHMNVGLGHDFLRHIERTKALAYVVDLSAGTSDNKGSPPWVQFEDLKYELEMYQPGLSDKPALVVGTKLDEKGSKEAYREFKKRYPHATILAVCAPLEEGIHDLRIALRELVTNEKYK